MRRRTDRPRLDPTQRALLVAVVVSALAHHTILGFIPAPTLVPPPRRPPVTLAVYEPASAVPPEPAAPDEEMILPPLVEPPALPIVVARVEPHEAEAPRRDERPPRPPEPPPVPPEPPPQAEDRPRPPEPPPVPEQEATTPPSPAEVPINLHFVHLPPPRDESDRIPEHARFFADRTQDVEEETRARVTVIEGPEAERSEASARMDQPETEIDGRRDGRQVDERDGRDEDDREAQAAARPRPAGAESGRPGPRDPPVRPVEAVAARPAEAPRDGGERGTGADRSTEPSEGAEVPESPGGILAAADPTSGRTGRPDVESPPADEGRHGESDAALPEIAARAGAAGSNRPPGDRGTGAPGSTADGAADPLRPTYALLEEVLGATADREREEFLERRRERRRIGGAAGRADRVMAQLENFNPDVRPGNQTALDTLFHPFASFIDAFHRRLHPHWGDGFVASLVAFPDTHPLNDMALVVKLEFSLNPDGTVEKVTVVRPSGNTVFDVAAIDAVFAGEPYPSPPEAIRSGDGRVYMRYSFHRDHNQCGTWLAEPYLLPDPPSLHEEGEPGGSEHPVRHADPGPVSRLDRRGGPRTTGPAGPPAFPSSGAIPSRVPGRPLTATAPAPAPGWGGTAGRSADSGS
jgi:TonB family protein